MHVACANATCMHLVNLFTCSSMIQYSRLSWPAVRRLTRVMHTFTFQAHSAIQQQLAACTSFAKGFCMHTLEGRSKLSVCAMLQYGCRKYIERPMMTNSAWDIRNMKQLQQMASKLLHRNFKFGMAIWSSAEFMPVPNELEIATSKMLRQIELHRAR